MSRSLSEHFTARRVGALAFSAGATVLTSLVLSAGSVAAERGPSATGSGHFNSFGRLRTFAFSAITHQDGSVTGQAQLGNRGDNTTEHLSINCLEVMGNIAYISGFVLDSSNPDLVGGTGVFSVQDNGEGAKSPRDQMSIVTNSAGTAPMVCQSEHPAPDNQIDGGNIQIH